MPPSRDTPSPAAAERTRRLLGWLGYAAAWLALGLWLALNTIVGRQNAGRPIPAWEPLTWELSSVAVVAVLAVAIARFERRFPLSSAGWPRRLPLHFAAALVFSLLHVGAMFALRTLAYAAVGERYDFGDPWLAFAYELQKDLITYATIVGACIAWRAVRLRRERELALVRLERDLSEARLAQLTAQIEPHFMFNTLNAIAEWCREDGAVAERAILQLSSMIRTMMTGINTTTWPLEREIELVDALFALHAIRDPSLFSVDRRVPDPVPDVEVPPMVLLPLVENAMKHGPLARNKGVVVFAITTSADAVFVELSNPGAYTGPREGGSGLPIVEKRLALAYGRSARFSIERDGDRTRASMTLPRGASME